MKKTNDPNKKSKQQKLPLQCAICGQKSRFKYYNVQSCESCKQFFRRIVMKQKEFHCLKFWTCDFLQGERCRGCRLDKCLSLGMDPSMVNVQMTEKLQDFIIKLEKRRRKLLDPNYSKYKIEATGPGSEQSGECSTSAEQEELLDKDEEQEIEDVDCRIQLMNSEESGLQLQANWSPINTEMKIQNSPPWRIEPSLQQLGSLLQTEEKIRRIHYSCTELPPSYLDKYTTIGELIQRMDNLLSSAKQFSQQPTKHWIRPYVLASVQKNGIWGRKPVFFIRDLILSIDFARTLPVFNRLILEDQISLVSSFALSASRMIISFYSMERNSQTIILPNGMPIAEQFKCSLRLAADPILESMSRKVYDRTVMNLKKVAPTKEEFILLLQLLFLDSAISGLTEGAQRLLKEEAEKCGKALLFLQQSRFGDQAGAQRYMETLSLVWHSNTNSRSYREFLVYLDAIYEQGRFEKAMPRMLSSICMLGPRELPSLPEGL